MRYLSLARMVDQSIGFVRFLAHHRLLSSSNRLEHHTCFLFLCAVSLLALKPWTAASRIIVRGCTHASWCSLGVTPPAAAMIHDTTAMCRYYITFRVSERTEHRGIVTSRNPSRTTLGVEDSARAHALFMSVPAQPLACNIACRRARTDV